MISRVPQKGSAWLAKSSLVTLMGLPPKNPQNDDDEDEEDEEDDDEGEEEPQRSSENRTNVSSCPLLCA